MCVYACERVCVCMRARVCDNRQIKLGFGVRAVQNGNWLLTFLKSEIGGKRGCVCVHVSQENRSNKNTPADRAYE